MIYFSNFEGQAADPNFGQVVLLVSGDGTDGGNSFTDESASAHTLTAAGNVQQDTGITHFAPGTILLDGTGDYLEAADSADFDLDGEFTVEAWVYGNAWGNNWRGVVGRGTNWHFYVHAGWVKFRFTGDTSGLNTSEGDSSAVLLTGEWHHIAADRDASGVLRTYCDGVFYDKNEGVTGALVASSTVVRVGRFTGGFNTEYFDGNIEELRITKGTARYASDAGYAVPTGPFPRS